MFRVLINNRDRPFVCGHSFPQTVGHHCAGRPSAENEQFFHRSYFSPPKCCEKREATTPRLLFSHHFLFLNVWRLLRFSGEWRAICAIKQEFGKFRGHNVGENDECDDRIEVRWHRLKTEHTGKGKIWRERRYDHNHPGRECQQFARPASEKWAPTAHDEHD